MSADRLRFLAGSDNRPETLAALRASGPLDRDGIAPMTEKRSSEQLADRIRSGDAIEFEAVLSAATLEASRSNPEYADAFETTAAADAVDVAVYPEAVDLFLCVADDTAAVGASKDDRPYAMAVTDDPAVREWAIDTFEDYWQRAEPVA